MGEQIEEETYIRHFEELGAEKESFKFDHHITSRIIHARSSTISIGDTLSTEQIKIPPTVTNTRDNYTRRRYSGLPLHFVTFSLHGINQGVPVTLSAITPVYGTQIRSIILLYTTRRGEERKS